MPTYDYECAEGHRFEVFQRISDDPIGQCPTCGAEARRVISGGAGFLFKGDGFYITDYRSDDYRKKASAETGGASDSGSASESKSASDSAKGNREPKKADKPASDG